jgi:hypothetical protein
MNNELHDAHIQTMNNYDDYMNNLADQEANDQMREAEGRWEDQGCSNNYDYKNY